MTFDPMVEAIRSALRALDRDPQAARAYLDLIEAYEKCADKENEPQLLEQADYVIRDVKQLSLTAEEKERLSLLEARVAATLARIKTVPSAPDP